MGKQINEREIVLEILMEITENGAYSHKILGDVLSKYQYLEKRERAFITRVVEGTLEHMIEIDYILNQISKTKVKKMKPVIRNILRSSVYQLKYMDSVPDHAVCSEAVKLAVRKGFSGLQGYVNGVLRNIVRKMDEIEYPKEDVQRLSVKYSVPEWILSLWKKEYGEEITEKMAADFQKEKPITIRCCMNRVTPEVLKEKLEAEGAKVEAHPYLPYAFYLSDYDYLEGLESFQEGLFAVQDISSMFVGELAAPKAGDHVIDVCAAPGGKSLHVAEKLQLADEAAARENGTEEKAGRVEARDLTEYKTDLIWQNIDRSGLGNICAVCKDASVFDKYDEEAADLVIADLPCSGLGVLGKKPDLKYRVQPEDLEELADLQRKILTCAQAIVKEGGTLLYSTCTVNPGADITISADLGQVSDDDINDYIDSNVLSNFATTNEVKDRAAADGDTVNIDYVGRIDGVAFDGGDTKGSGADLTLGSGTYIDNFEDQIVGHTPGETFDVTVTFPEDYGNEDLNGKEAVFETTLNYIKESVTPELTDDWVKENLGESMSLNSVDELKAFVKSTMLYDNQASDVYTDLHDKASYADELPQTALDYYRDVLLYRIYTNAQKYGTDMNTLLSSGMMGSSYDSVDAYLADANDSIKSITQQALLMQAVAEKTGFKCDTATMNADFGRYYGTTDPSQYVSAYGENYIKMNVLQSDVMQNLIDNVKYE